MKKKAILLVRVSTLSQDYSPQIRDLEDFAKTKGFECFHVIETKESGLIDYENRTGTNELFSFIQDNPQYKTLFVTELSRLGRTQSVLHRIKDWLVTNKVQLFLKDTDYSLFDSNGKVSPAGDIMFTLYGYFAESEVKQKKDRFLRSRKKLMAEGLSISGKTLFGYKRVKKEGEKSYFVHHPKNAEHVRTIFNWYAKGIDDERKNPSIRVIAIECQKKNMPEYLHSKRNVNKLLKEEGYLGEKTTNNKRKNPRYKEGGNEEEFIITQNKIKYNDEPIIDKELFSLVQEKLKSNNSKADKSSEHTTILAKLIRCNSCSRHLNANYRFYKGGNKHSYRCSSRSGAKPCGSKKSFSMQMIDSAVWSLIKTDLKALTNKIKELNPNQKLAELSQYVKNLEDRINSNDEEYDLNLTKYDGLTGKGPKVKKKLEKYSRKMDKLEQDNKKFRKEIARLKSEINLNQKDSEDVYKVINENLDKIESSKELLKKYVNHFIKEIKILQHSSSFTTLKIEFKYFSKSQLNNCYIHDDELDIYVELFIDKRTTRNIRIIKSTKILTPKGNNIQLGKKMIPLKALFDKKELKSIEIDKYNRFKKIPFTKLKLYKQEEKN